MKYILLFTALAVLLIGGLIVVIIKTIRNNKRLLKTENKKLELNEENSETFLTETTNPFSKLSDKEVENALQCAEIEIKNSLGEVMLFERLNPVSETKYQEVMLCNADTALGAVVNSKMTNDARKFTEKQIAENLKGTTLFKASCDPDTLCKYADGTWSTMVSENGKFSKHSGMNKLSKEELQQLVEAQMNPATIASMGMQAMTAATSQIMLEEINEQLQFLNDKIDRYRDYEKIGILQNAKNRMLDLNSHKFISENDLQEIRNIRNALGNLYSEFKVEMIAQRNILNSTKINLMNVLEIKNSYKSNIDAYNKAVSMCYESNKLMLQADLSEIALRLKKDRNDNSLQDVIGTYKSDRENSFYLRVNDNPNILNEDINEHIKNSLDRKWYITKKTKDKKYEKMEYKTNEIVDLIIDDKEKRIDSVGSLDEKKMIFVADENTKEQRVFIEVKD